MKRLSFFAAAATIGASGICGPAFAASAFPPHRLTGKVLSVNRNTMVLERRNGTTVTVDLTEAVVKGRVGIVEPTMFVAVYGSYNSDRTFHCVFTSSAPPQIVDWLTDQ